jgi:hypothetical protein
MSKTPRSLPILAAVPTAIARRIAGGQRTTVEEHWERPSALMRARETVSNLERSKESKKARDRAIAPTSLQRVV